MTYSVVPELAWAVGDVLETLIPQVLETLVTVGSQLSSFDGSHGYIPSGEG